MKPLVWLTGLRSLSGRINRKNAATGTSAALLSTLVVVAAVQSDGARATNIRLDDGSIWVTNTASQAIGRLNIRVDELDFARIAAPGSDVLQDGRDVVFAGVDAGVQRLDVISGQPSGNNDVALPQYQLGGGRSIVFDDTTQRIWIGPSSGLAGTEYPKDADAQLEPGSRVHLTLGAEGDLGSTDGKIMVVEADQYYELALDENGEPIRPLPEPSETTTSAAPTTTVAVAPGDTEPDRVPDPIAEPDRRPLAHSVDETMSISSVGDRLVFLGPDGSVFGTDGDVAKVPGESAVLQEPGFDDSDVLVATTEGLFSVKIGSSDVEQLAESTGAPSAPVRVGPCVYGAWSGPAPTWFKACNDKVVTDVSPIPQASADATLVFRVNQRNVALNSTGDGGAWADHDGSLAYVGNWESALAQNDTTDDSGTADENRTTEQDCVEGGAEVPTAGDDQIGLRPRQSILDVLWNDDDVNCEPIAIAPETVEPSSGEWGKLTVIDNGQHLLYTPSDAAVAAAATAKQTFTFQYAVDDSSGNRSNPVSVRVDVYASALGNLPPQLRKKNNGSNREMTAVVEEGRAVAYDVSADWWDPDGDDMTLTNALVDQGAVSYTPQGVVRYEANGVTASKRSIDVTMSDGTSSAVEKLEVTVKPTGSAIPPVTANDFATVLVGQSVRVKPLANDSDPNEDELTFFPAWTAADEAFRSQADTTDGSVELTGVAPGVYRLTYNANDNDSSTPGSIRLRVIARAETNQAPVAVPDEVRLRPNRVVNVDVLANDVDLDGDDLAVVGVTADAAATGEVRATIVERRLVQLEVVPGADGQAPQGQFSVRYTIDDGRNRDRIANGEGVDLLSTGLITVTVIDPAQDQAPAAADDAATVRSGSVIAIPVLANDSDADNDPLSLAGLDTAQAAAIEAAGQGVVWTSGRNVYFRGELTDQPLNVPVLYSVEANGKKASAVLTVRVMPPQDSSSVPNNAPKPKPLVIRAVRGATVRVLVPTAGVDQDGDPVEVVPQFVGLSGAAQGNEVAADDLNKNVLLFTAGASAGSTDQFEYSVRDPYGLTGSATARVVVVDDSGLGPVAHDDVVRAKPGRTINVPVMANDTSPQDLTMILSEEPFFVDGVASADPAHPENVAVLDQSDPKLQGRISVEVPTDGNTLVEQYRIEDERGRGATAALRVTPDEQAPNLAPIAADIDVPAEKVAGKPTVSVDVLAESYDPDDENAQLAVSIPAQAFQAASVATDSTITIPVQRIAQTVLYRIEDGDGATAVGIINVAGDQNHPP